MLSWTGGKRRWLQVSRERHAVQGSKRKAARRALHRGDESVSARGPNAKASKKDHGGQVEVTHVANVNGTGQSSTILRKDHPSGSSVPTVESKENAFETDRVQAVLRENREAGARGDIHWMRSLPMAHTCSKQSRLQSSSNGNPDVAIPKDKLAMEGQPKLYLHPVLDVQPLLGDSSVAVAAPSTSIHPDVPNNAGKGMALKDQTTEECHPSGRPSEAKHQHKSVKSNGSRWGKISEHLVQASLQQPKSTSKGKSNTAMVC